MWVFRLPPSFSVAEVKKTGPSSCYGAGEVPTRRRRLRLWAWVMFVRQRRRQRTLCRALVPTSESASHLGKRTFFEHRKTRRYVQVWTGYVTIIGLPHFIMRTLVNPKAVSAPPLWPSHVSLTPSSCKLKAAVSGFFAPVPALVYFQCCYLALFAQAIFPGALDADSPLQARDHRVGRTCVSVPCKYVH